MKKKFVLSMLVVASLGLTIGCSSEKNEEVSVTEEQESTFNEIKKAIIDKGNGFIIDIQPRFEANDWTRVAVILDDAWYKSQQHEKERFSEKMGEIVENSLRTTGKVKEDNVVLVYMVDSHGKELAGPKITGGYKIK